MKLGDQWIEVIDGHEHMVKAIEKVSEKSYDCTGCIFNGHNGTCMYHSQDCPIGEVEHGYIKDLGILNANGFLPIPFDVPDGYPRYPVINEYSRNSDDISELFQVSYSHMNCHINFGIYNTKQQAIDAWNRRE